MKREAPSLEELVEEAGAGIKPESQGLTDEDFELLTSVQADINRTIREWRRGKDKKTAKTHKRLRRLAQGIFLSEGLLLPSQPIKDVGKPPAITLPADVDEETRSQIIKVAISLGKNFVSILPTLLIEKEEQAVGNVDDVYEALYTAAPEVNRPEIKGFERLEIDNELLAKILEQTFPKEWLSDVHGVTYSGQNLKLPPEYGLNLSAAAICEARIGSESAKIIYGDVATVTSDIKILERILAHEVAHSADPVSHAGLKLEDRVRFMQRIADRVVAADRFQSTYVENIKNPDPQARQFHRAVEYWGVIWETYLTDPELSTLRLAPADLELILDYLKLTAPDFNAKLAAEMRAKLVSQEDKKIALVMESLNDTFDSRKERSDFYEFLKHGRQALNYKIPKPGIGTKIAELNKDLQKLLAGVRPDWRELYVNRLEFLDKRVALRELAVSSQYSVVFKKILLNIKNDLVDAQRQFQKMLKRLPDEEAGEARRFFKKFEDLMYKYDDLDWSNTWESL